MEHQFLSPPHSNPGRLIKVEHNITQVSCGREATFSNIDTTFGGYFFQDISDGDFLWSAVTAGGFLWFTAGNGTSGTGAADPAAVGDYKMASADAYFEQTGGTPQPLRQVTYEQNTAAGELVMVFRAARTAAITGGAISEVGIYMSHKFTGWDAVSTDRSTYVLGDDSQSPRRPTLIARAVVPAENRITKAAGNEIYWRWTLKFTG